MGRCISSFTLALSVAAAPLWAQPAGAPTIDHQGVACIVAGKYPKLVACFNSEITNGQAWFHAQGDKSWYWVKQSEDPKLPAEAMQPNALCYAWVLPRPGRKLINKHVEYYIQAGSSRTGEFDPLVVRRALECKKNAPVAPTSPTGPAGVFPTMAPGFMGNFPTAAVVTTAAVGGGLAALLASGGDNAVTPPPTGTPPAAPPPPPPPAPPEPPTVSPLALSCQADPKSGQAPLKVAFTSFPSGGTGSYNFDWRFGDGTASNGKHPTHTYTSPGSYGATLTVTSGDQFRQCERGITVNEPPPAMFRLTVAKAGAGSGTVTDGHGKINCGSDCTATYVSGTQVELKQTAGPNSVFGGWSGDCTGMGSCVVDMNGNKSVAAKFDAAAPPPPPKVRLDFTAVEEEGGCDMTFTIDPPGTDCTTVRDPGTTCTEFYTAGTDVSITSPEVPDGCGNEVCWSGACFGTPTTPGSVCMLTMDTDKVAGANIIFGSCNGDTESAGPHRGPSWVFQLDVPGALGQAVVDGAIVVAESGRRAQLMARKREGEAVVAATLIKGAGQPGTWRFEAQEGDTLEPGSLRVLHGEVALLTPTAVVFRLKGVAGEQVAFSYRLRR